MERKWIQNIEIDTEFSCEVFFPLAPLGDSQGLSDTAGSYPKLRVRVGDSAFMGCVVQSTEEKHVVKVDWILSKGEHAVVRRRPAGVRMGVGESVIESSR